MATGGIDMMTARISEACEAGEKFVEIFYETMDKRRQVGGVDTRCSLIFLIKAQQLLSLYAMYMHVNPLCNSTDHTLKH